jgi:hypothetical protein
MTDQPADDTKDPRLDDESVELPDDEAVSDDDSPPVETIPGAKTP